MVTHGEVLRQVDQMSSEDWTTTVVRQRNIDFQHDAWRDTYLRAIRWQPDARNGAALQDLSDLRYRFQNWCEMLRIWLRRRKKMTGKLHEYIRWDKEEDELTAVPQIITRTWMRRFKTLEEDALGDRAVNILRQLDERCAPMTYIHPHPGLDIDLDDDSSDEEETQSQKDDLPRIVRELSKLKTGISPSRRDHSGHSRREESLFLLRYC